MPDSPTTIARDLVAEVGRAAALRYLAREWWTDTRAWWRLAAVVLFA